ncbi:sugar phosphate isomerase/epimerase family protein [Anaerocolumna sp. AGMB13020]|uniref:sugar phosphate isomerase/epimerase family protein n=1 Tax=Anaerocolumna sp. AGMB13020 TaxID=3081750 RepID=UPI0029540F72|nr:sugar phosphate isomerase/epimerase family protein [Anaerocolumna sp. AGMB13020]WOO36092.1 sugar phosphate isomerase/epimerase family protein [Anaerocolumna sp. AGMB13020]
MLRECRITGFADEISDSLQEQAGLLKQLGMEYLELRSVNGRNVADFTIEEIKEIKSYLDSEGIKVSAIGSPIGKISIKAPFKEHLERFKRVVETAHLFETPNIRMFSFYMEKEERPEDYKNTVIERLGELKNYGKNHRAVLLHENEKGIYGETAERCSELFQALYDENFKAVFDFANFVQCKEDTLKAYELLKPYISYIHIKDAVFETGEVRPAGMGDGNIKEILTDLDISGYNGFLSLEPHLADFTMLKQLEESTLARRMTNREMAFHTAHEALLKILNA